MIDVDPLDTDTGTWNATDEFGSALHTIQDLYTHANWVEMGFPLSDDPADNDGVEGTWGDLQVAQSDLVDFSGAHQSLATDWFFPGNGALVRGPIQFDQGPRDVLLGNDDWDDLPVEWEIGRKGSPSMGAASTTSPPCSA